MRLSEDPFSHFALVYVSRTSVAVRASGIGKVLERKATGRQHLFLSVYRLCLVPRIIIYIKEMQAALSYFWL